MSVYVQSPPPKSSSSRSSIGTGSGTSSRLSMPPSSPSGSLFAAEAAAEEEVVAVGKLTASTTLSRLSTAAPLRLMQQAPAWDLHLLLRMKGLAYRTENVLFPAASGHRLPLLVSGNIVMSDANALFSLHWDSRPFFIGSAELNSEDVVLASYVNDLRTTARKSFLESSGDNGSKESTAAKAKRLLNAFGLSIWEHLPFSKREFGSSATHIMAGAVDSMELKFIKDAYSLFSRKLEANKGESLTASQTGCKYADAILFAHLMEVRRNEAALDVLKDFPLLVTFREELFNKYFLQLQSYQSSNFELCLNALIRDDADLLKVLSASSAPVGSISTPRVVYDGKAPARVEACRYVYDFAYTQLLPWKTSPLFVGDCVADPPVLIGLRGAVMGGIVAASFLGYFVQVLKK